VLGLLTVLVHSTSACAQSGPTHGSLIKDARWAAVLGAMLFRDTSRALVAPGALDGAAQLDASGLDQYIASLILARRPIEQYQGLIEKAFDETLWKSADPERLRRSFPVIWRLSLWMYQAAEQRQAPRLRVCLPGNEVDAFDCHDESEPVVPLPIPSQGPQPVWQEQPITG